MNPPHTLRFLAILVIALSSIGLKSEANIPADKRAKASELFQALKTNTDDFEKREEIVREMIDLGRPVTEILLKQLVREWEPLQKTYLSNFATAADSAARKKKTGEMKTEAEKLAAQVRSLRGVGNLTKDMIKAKGEPAMKRLREITRVTSVEVLAGSEELAKLRARVLGIGNEILICEDQLLVDEEDKAGFSKEKFADLEKTTATDAIGIDRSFKQILENNEAIALKEEVPEAEAAGIRDLNEMRILIGLPPVALDPKLCDASRMHSEDMAKEKFFAHDSPVSGRETPWKRAKLAGTSASAENIFAGSKSPKAANKAWFFSPGHHKNMFGNHRRGGMGLYENKWTQMFGR